MLVLLASYAKAAPCECENKDGKTDCSKCFQAASDKILPEELKAAFKRQQEKKEEEPLGLQN